MSKKTLSRRPSRRKPHGALWSTALITAVIAAVALMAILTRPDTGGLAATGEVNDMGLPVVTTPGASSDEAHAAGVAVSGADWALGQVPLDVSVQPEWTLTNTGDATVVLGEPHAEVREGCCPGPLALTDSELAPGEQAVLTFDLAMHTGMDGWHDIAVHVPVEGEALTLSVTGDFRS